MGDLETAEALMTEMHRKELCQVYLDEMDAEEVGLEEAET